VREGRSGLGLAGRESGLGSGERNGPSKEGELGRGFGKRAGKLGWVWIRVSYSFSPLLFLFLNQTKLFEFKFKFEFNTNTQTNKRDAPA
jgi:hypothetical protein